MTTTTHTTRSHGHPTGEPATAGVFAAQHLFYLLPAVCLFLAVRAVALLQLGGFLLWLLAVGAVAGRWAGPRLHAAAWVQIPGAFGRRRREAPRWTPVTADYGAALIKAVVIGGMGWWVASAPSTGAPLFTLFLAAYMTAGLVNPRVPELPQHRSRSRPGMDPDPFPGHGQFRRRAVLALAITTHQGLGAILTIAAAALGRAVGSTLVPTRA